MRPVVRTETVPVHLTPLTPIHIGCGEDFVPTSYVIEDKVLYAFNAAQVPLAPADRQALIAAIRRPGADGVVAVQRFFSERMEDCKGAAYLAIPVAQGVAQEYVERVGRIAQRSSGDRKDKTLNRLFIERTAHHPHTGIPYLPGSSLKGAIRTAWLDAKNNGRPKAFDREKGTELEKRVLPVPADFETDPFRCLTVSDSQGIRTAAQIVFSTNHKKRPVFRDGKELFARGLSARRECIAPGPFADFTCPRALSSSRRDQAFR